MQPGPPRGPSRAPEAPEAHTRIVIEPSKLYFRIGEVASIVGVEPHVLRYWEREFRVIRPTKSAKGQRVYSRRDLENLLRVRELLYDEGFTIAGAKKKLQRKGLLPPEETSEVLDAVAGVSNVGEQKCDEVPETRRSGPTNRAARERAEPSLTSATGDAEGRARQTLADLRSEIEGFLTEEW